VDTEAEVGRNCKKIHGRGRKKRAKNGRSKPKKAGGEKHRCQQKCEGMAVQGVGESPEADRNPHGERGTSVARQRGIPIARDPTLQIGSDSRHLFKTPPASVSSGGKQ
jgi:hypothetical protein